MVREGAQHVIGTLYPYPKMKDSGIPWLGEVPEHWRLPRLGALLRERGETNGDGQVSEVLSVLRKRGVIPYAEKGNIGNKKSEDITRYKVVKPDDIVVNCMNVIIGSVGLSRYTGCLSPVYYVLTRRSEHDHPRYLNAYFQTKPFQESLVRIGNGILAHRMRIPMELLKCEPFPLPPFPEQAAIVRFLDHIDRRIRRYIRAKQRLIASLEEQKQAIINRAVTGQIDVRTGQTYPAYKTSGVEWLGDVPENWEKRRLKSISRIRYGLGQPPRELSDGLPLIRATNVDHGRIVEKDLVYVDALDVPKSRDAFLSKKEIIVVRSGAYTADSAIIPEAYEGAVAGYDMIVTVSGAQPEFIAIALLSNYVRDDQLIISSTRSAQPHINAEELGTAVLLLPPLDEQAAIVRYLDKATADIDIATDRARRQIDLLKEYRTRLIADVVTGKLDVREAATGLPEVDLLADEFDVLTESPETGMMELEAANETPEELAMENEATV